MAKKPVELVQIPTTDQVIDTSIDMKLSKQDLIDVVIEETREALQAKVEDATDAYEVERVKTEKALNGLKAIFKKAIETKYTKELKLLQDNGGIDSDDSIDDYRGYVATEHGVFSNYGDDGLSSQKVRTNRGHWSHQTTTNNGQVVNIQYRLPTTYNVSNKQADGRKKNLVIMNIRLCLSLSETEVEKIYSDFIGQVKALSLLKKELDNLQEQLNGVDKMGKKAKTQLIKRILESSNDGQALLANVGSIKASIGQLLLEGSK